jgi:hypothetical protein
MLAYGSRFDSSNPEWHFPHAPHRRSKNRRALRTDTSTRSRWGQFSLQHTQLTLSCYDRSPRRHSQETAFVVDPSPCRRMNWISAAILRRSIAASNGAHDGCRGRYGHCHRCCLFSAPIVCP